MADLIWSNQSYINTDPAFNGWVVPRSSAVSYYCLNNYFETANLQNYVLDAGDEAPSSYNNNFDGAVVTGNKYYWHGSNDSGIQTHGVFLGYNINCYVRYNYINGVPYALIFKSGTDAGVNMTFTSGGCAYNVFRNGKFFVRGKGINSVPVYNNTFYDGSGYYTYYLIYISTNMDRSIPADSTGWKIKNNIFYQVDSGKPCIQLETTGCRTGFECDYNIYWSVSGTNNEPVFKIAGSDYTWTQWKALGYDAHSYVMNPNFINTTSLVPQARLDYGTNLGSTWNTGLSTSAVWTVGSSPSTQVQDSTWQVGAYIYAGETEPDPVIIDNLKYTKVYVL